MGNSIDDRKEVVSKERMSTWRKKQCNLAYGSHECTFGIYYCNCMGCSKQFLLLLLISFVEWLLSLVSLMWVICKVDMYDEVPNYILFLAAVDAALCGSYLPSCDAALCSFVFDAFFVFALHSYSCH